MFIGNRKRAVKIAMVQRAMETRTAIVIFFLPLCFSFASWRIITPVSYTHLVRAAFRGGVLLVLCHRQLLSFHQFFQPVQLGLRRFTAEVLARKEDRGAHFQKAVINPGKMCIRDSPMRQSLRQARATRKLLPPFYPIMPDIAALVRKWTDNWCLTQ